MSDPFDQFVSTKAAEASNTGGDLNLVREKEIWLDKIDELYALAEKSLSAYTVDGRIKLTKSDRMLYEELLGNYSVKAMSITIGREVVELEPVGTFLIGARGRIDVKGPRGTARLVVVPPGATEARIRIIDSSSPKEDALTTEKRPKPEDWVWKISTAPPRVTYIDLDEDTFRSTLMGVVNG